MFKPEKGPVGPETKNEKIIVKGVFPKEMLGDLKNGRVGLIDPQLRSIFNEKPLPDGSSELSGSISRELWEKLDNAVKARFKIEKIESSTEETEKEE